MTLLLLLLLPKPQSSRGGTPSSCILGTVREETVPYRFEVTEWDGEAKEGGGMG